MGNIVYSNFKNICRSGNALDPAGSKLANLILKKKSKPENSFFKKEYKCNVIFSQVRFRGYVSLIEVGVKDWSPYNLKVKVAQSCPTLCDPHGLYSPWNSLTQNTGVGSLSLLQGIVPRHGLNPGLPHCS